MLTINFAWIGLFIIIGILLFLLHNITGLNLFSRHDQKVIDKFLDKYPDVTEIFCKLPLREQNIENNQEIHEINKKLDILQRDMDEVRRTQRGGV
jgi:hypothetical protein